MPAGPLVTAALIVKDEEAVLPRCLASIRGWCDDILVVDTGSTDGTVEAALAEGATVLHHDWDGDFARARNHGLDHATGRWILYIDADEVADPVEPDLVRRELAGTDALALRVWFHVRPGFTPYREYRLWRNRPDLRFVGRMHESVVGNLRGVAGAEGLEIRDTELIRVRHDGYEGDQTAKHLRNRPLLEARLEELPDRVFLWNHLGHVRSALGDPEGALLAWQSGVDVVRRSGVVEPSDVLVYGSLGLALIDRRVDITDLLIEIDELAPWYRTRVWMRALHDRARGQLEDAIASLHELIAMRDLPPDPTLAYSEALFTDWAWEALADCLQ
ncbi:MAG: glycosyltransferase family 2 protein, partial [Actinomycetota bacterium]|nr:glycosyltransferase family 2 protein [Actinomycetota bacterium]